MPIDVPGQIVAFFEPNSQAMVEALFRVWDAGGVTLILNPRLPQKRLGEVLEDLGVAALYQGGLFHPLKGRKMEGLEAGTLLFTSGSSGPPKLAMHSLEQLKASARASLEAMPLEPQDRWRITLPLYHVGGIGILFRTQIAGARCVFDDPATHVSWVDTHLSRQKTRPNYRAILVGGGPVSKKNRIKASDWPVYETYGLTEMSSQVATAPLGEPLFFLPHVEWKIEKRELFLRGKSLFSGYWGQAKQEGYFATGDLVRREGNGIRIVGRKDAMFISGGENIQPEEIEGEILRLPGVEACVVFPVPDPEYGHRPAVAIRWEGETGSLGALSERLPTYKLPVAIFPLPEDYGLKPSRKHLIGQYQ